MENHHTTRGIMCFCCYCRSFYSNIAIIKMVVGVRNVCVCAVSLKAENFPATFSHTISMLFLLFAPFYCTPCELREQRLLRQWKCSLHFAWYATTNTQAIVEQLHQKVLYGSDLMDYNFNFILCFLLLLKLTRCELLCMRKKFSI